MLVYTAYVFRLFILCVVLFNMKILTVFNSSEINYATFLFQDSDLYL